MIHQLYKTIDYDKNDLMHVIRRRLANHPSCVQVDTVFIQDHQRVMIPIIKGSILFQIWEPIKEDLIK